MCSSSLDERTASCETKGEMSSIGLIVFMRNPLYTPIALFAFDISFIISQSYNIDESSTGNFAGICGFGMFL